MTVATPDPLPRTRTTVHCHGFGIWYLPPLHELEGAKTLLIQGRAADVLMLDGVPATLIEAMKGRSPEDAARFFCAWINAGFDLEAAAWGGYLGLHRVLFAGEEEPTPGDPEPEEGIVYGEGIEDASELDDLREYIAAKTVANWRVLQ